MNTQKRDMSVIQIIFGDIIDRAVKKDMRNAKLWAYVLGAGREKRQQGEHNARYA